MAAIDETKQFIPLNIAVLTVSDTRALADDKSGQTLADRLTEAGHHLAAREIVTDDVEAIRAMVKKWIADAGVDVVITTGGTGISPTDATPEITRAVLDYEVPGLADAIRAAGAPTVPTAVLSRGLTGVAGRTLVVNLPGSTGGVRDGLAVLAGVLDHAVDQLRGGDHR